MEILKALKGNTVSIVTDSRDVCFRNYSSPVSVRFKLLKLLTEMNLKERIVAQNLY